MVFYIKQKVFSWRDRFFVKDEHENDVFYIEGELFSWGKKLSFKDMQGRELAFIKQKLWSFLPRYEIYMNGQLAFEVVKEFTFFKSKFSILGKNWGIEGNFLSYDYKIMSGNQMKAQILKKFFTWGDSYAVNIYDDSDYLSVLICAIVIDCICHDDDGGAGSINT